MNENSENICKKCAYYGTENNSDSACNRCPVATNQYHEDNSMFQRPQIICDESHVEKNVKLLMFIERIFDTFRNKQTLDIFRLYLGNPKLSISVVAKQTKLSRQNVYHHINKIKRTLPEIFTIVEHQAKVLKRKQR